MTQLAVDDLVDSQEERDNPGRVYHLVCGRCVPVLPPVGTPYVRFCGMVLTRKDEPGILANVESPPPEACVVCTSLAKCTTCGAARWMCHK